MSIDRPPRVGGSTCIIITRRRRCAGRIKDRYPADQKHAEYIPTGVWPEFKKSYFDIAHASSAMPPPLC